MNIAEAKVGELLARILRECVREGQIVHLGELGSFQQRERGGLEFIADSTPRIFIAYANEDLDIALRLADELTAAGFHPWIDKRKLMAGQNWRGAIERAIERSDYFVACFSSRSVGKRGQFPNELRLALRCADRMPLDDSFLLPVRLEPCEVPARIQAHLQWVDLFPDWQRGVRHLTEAIWEDFGQRLGRS